MTAPLVVVGAGLAGWTTVREFRKLDAETPIVVISSDSGDFYAKPTLSNALAQKRTPAQLVSMAAAKMVETLKVRLLAHSTVTQLDIAQHVLAIDTPEGQQTLVYDKLVLATGAQPIRSALAGNAADQVVSVNSLEDFTRFFGLLHPASHAGEPTPKTVLVIGAGLIGCEFANDLLHAGHRVHIVAPSSRPLDALLPEATGLQLQQALQAQGAQWHFGTTVQVVNWQEADGEEGRKLLVILADGNVIAVDAVLSAIGLRANTALAASAGLLCERGIVVDAFLQTSVDAVYALGDAAQYISAGDRTLPFVMPIMSAAKALAATLAGQRTELVFPLMPVSIKTPALPIVVSPAPPQVAGEWLAEAAQEAEPLGLWRYMDSDGVQRGFVLSGKSAARRMELSKATVL